METKLETINNADNAADHDGVVISTVNDSSDAEVLHVRTNNTTYANGTSLMLVRGDGNVGIVGPAGDAGSGDRGSRSRECDIPSEG